MTCKDAMLTEESHCPECRMRALVYIHERKPDGHFAPGKSLRCANCKREFPPPPEPQAPDERGAMQPDATERDRASEAGNEDVSRWPDGSCMCPRGATEDETIHDFNLTPRCPRCDYALGGNPMTDAERAEMDADDQPVDLSAIRNLGAQS